MRYTVLLLAYLAALAVTPGAAVASDTGACYNIADADARTYCIARARKEPAQCYSIQSSAMRSMCLAEVRK